MLLRGSRYSASRRFTEDPRAEQGAFRGLRPRPIGPATGVIEHVVKAGERIDLLARHYYNDDRLWWRIVDANSSFLSGGDMTLAGVEGRVILIPKARE
jgi:hypothetical protein